MAAQRRQRPWPPTAARNSGSMTQAQLDDTRRQLVLSRAPGSCRELASTLRNKSMQSTGESVTASNSAPPRAKAYVSAIGPKT